MRPAAAINELERIVKVIFNQINKVTAQDRIAVRIAIKHTLGLNRIVQQVKCQ